MIVCDHQFQRRIDAQSGKIYCGRCGAVVVHGVPINTVSREPLDIPFHVEPKYRRRG
jgi:hypothetical protein